jgi:hypothetical protein
MKLKNMSYYVVEVAFNQNNPIHRSVCFHRSGGNVDMFGSYEGVISQNISQLTFFQVIEEIPVMNTIEYPNKFKLPSQVDITNEPVEIEEI